MGDTAREADQTLTRLMAAMSLLAFAYASFAGAETVVRLAVFQCVLAVTIAAAFQGRVAQTPPASTETSDLRTDLDRSDADAAGALGGDLEAANAGALRQTLEGSAAVQATQGDLMSGAGPAVLGAAVELSHRHRRASSGDGIRPLLEAAPLSAHQSTAMGGRHRVRLLARVVLFFTLGLVPLTFHFSTGKAVLAGDRELVDDHIVAIDSVLLGWLCPKGQLALCAQLSTLWTPSSPLGLLLTEYLQITYITYYFWGNGLLVVMMLIYLHSVAKRTLAESEANWLRLQQTLLGIVGAYVANFGLNLLFPAVSPRLFLAGEYTVPLEGLFVAGFFNNMVKTAAADSFGAFPSGHVAQTWLASGLAYRLGFHQYSRVCHVAAVSMTLATLYLRYHYLCDVLGGLALMRFGIYLSGLHVETAPKPVSTSTHSSVETGEPHSGKAEAHSD
eukprot:TRINITY_DN7592_c0_g1_i1.p1 TRINITY_DN7592_c0_g1~~TRINITY_DN7592_c0_g1_i1.p1  ORF type:complete len:460 (-),score=113.45 TRINITY_DN7592_c0_g1_i1:64-1401(-)